MAKTFTEEEQLSISLGFRTDDAEDALDNFTSLFQRDFKRLESINKRHNKQLTRSNKDFYRLKSQAMRAEQVAQEHINEATGRIGKVQSELTHKAAAYNTALADMRDLTDRLTAARSAGNTALEDQLKLERDVQERQIKAIRSKMDAARGLMEEYQETISEAQDSLKSVQDLVEKSATGEWDPFKNVSESTREIGSDIGEAASAVMSKDARGAGEAIAKAAGKSLTKIIRSASMRALALSSERARKSGRVDESGAPKRGGPLEALGKSLSGLTNIMKLMGGPLMSLARLFLDADSMAKEFNRDILGTASTMRFLPRNFNNTAAAAAELDVVLKGVKNAAFALSNISWGLNKDDYKTTMNELTAAGMNLARFKDEAVTAKAAAIGVMPEAVERDTTKATEAVEELTTSTIHLAKAYSVSMGVSMQEVSALMGEMSGQMGMPLASIRLAFSKVASDAEEAGVEGNQFFNIIRGMSADMNLFNNRMEVAGKVLSKLMKVMDPRHAQQFLQEIGGFFKNRDIGARLKDVMTAGLGKTKVILQERLDVNMKSLAKDLEGSGVSESELKDAVSKGTAHLGKFFVSLEASGKKLSAGQREAIIEAANQQQKLARGGAGDVASALKDVDKIGSAMMLQAKAQGVLGKDIENLHDIELIAANNAIDLSDEQIDQYKKMLIGFDMMKEEMAKRIESGKSTEEDRELLKSIGAKGSDAEKAAAVRHTASLKLMSKSNDANKAVLEQMGKTEDFAQKVGQSTISISQMLEQLMDWFMQKFFDAIMGIWKVVSKIGWNDSEAEEAIKVAEMARSKSKFVSTAAKDETNVYKIKEKLLSGDKSFSESLGKAMDEQTKRMVELTGQLAKAQDDYKSAQLKQQSLADELKKAKTPKDKKRLEGEFAAATKDVESAYKRIEKITSEKEDIKTKKEDVVKTIGVEVIKEKGATGLTGEEGTLTKMGSYQGIVGEMAKAIKTKMDVNIGRHMGVEEAFQDALKAGFKGRSEEEIAGFQKIFAQQGMWNIDPKALVGITQPLEDNLPAMKVMGEEAVKKHSIYTHDTHVEPILANISSQLDSLMASTLMVRDADLLTGVQDLKAALLEVRDGVQDKSGSDALSSVVMEVLRVLIDLQGKMDVPPPILQNILGSLDKLQTAIQDAAQAPVETTPKADDLNGELLQGILTTMQTQGGQTTDTAILQSIATALGAGDTAKTPDLKAAHEANDLSEDMAETQELANASLADIYNVLRVKGIRINQSHLEGKYKKVITEGTQEAMETALMEYALMTDRKVAMKALDEAMAKGGSITPSGIMKGQLETAQKYIKKGDYAREKMEEAEETPPMPVFPTTRVPAPPILAAPPPPPTVAPTRPPPPAAAPLATAKTGDVSVHVTLTMKEGLEKLIAATADAVVRKRQ